jgi:hypothetical protein
MPKVAPLSSALVPQPTKSVFFICFSFNSLTILITSPAHPTHALPPRGPRASIDRINEVQDRLRIINRISSDSNANTNSSNPSNDPPPQLIKLPGESEQSFNARRLCHQFGLNRPPAGHGPSTSIPRPFQKSVKAPSPPSLSPAATSARNNIQATRAELYNYGSDWSGEEAMSVASNYPSSDSEDESRVCHPGRHLFLCHSLPFNQPTRQYQMRGSPPARVSCTVLSDGRALTSLFRSIMTVGGKMFSRGFRNHREGQLQMKQSRHVLTVQNLFSSQPQQIL